MDIEKAVTELYDPIDNVSDMPNDFIGKYHRSTYVGICENLAHGGWKIDWSTGQPRDQAGICLKHIFSDSSIKRMMKLKGH